MLTLFYDIASPYSYIACQLMKKGIRLKTIPCQYVPCDLHTLLTQTGNSFPGKCWNKAKHIPDDVSRIAKYHDINMRIPFHNLKFPINSSLAQCVGIAANRLGHNKVANYLADAYWQQGCRIDKLAVIQDLLTDLYLDADNIIECANSTEVTSQLAENTNRAFKAGAFGVPSFIVDGELFFGHDRLIYVEQAIHANV